jgi:hypothetical protein
MTFFNRAHRVALICGTTPLLLGMALFVVWLATRWAWLIVAGAVVFYGGLAVVATGVIALWISCRMAFRSAGVQRRRVWLSTLRCAGLLLANVVAAGCIIPVGIAVATRYTVVVYNASPRRLDGVRVFGGGCDALYGSLLPGANATRSFWIRQDDVLVFRASSGEDALEQTIDDYVTVNGSGHVRVTVHSDQAVLIARVAPHERTLLDRIRDVEIWRGRSLCKPVERHSGNSMPANIGLQPTAAGAVLGRRG